MLCRAESRPRMLALQVTAKNCYILARRTPRVISLVLACCGIIATRENSLFSRLVFPHNSNFSLLPFCPALCLASFYYCRFSCIRCIYALALFSRCKRYWLACFVNASRSLRICVHYVKYRASSHACGTHYRVNASVLITRYRRGLQRFFLIADAKVLNSNGIKC